MSGGWLIMDLKTHTNKICVPNEIGLRAQNLLTIMGSMVNMIGGGGTYLII